MLDFFTKDAVQHLGYIFTFLALSIKDVLWLRMILVLAQLILGTYQFMAMRYDIVFWNSIFTIVNAIHIVRIINDRKPVKIPKEIEDLYKKIFKNLTTKEFIYFWNLGQDYVKNESIIIKEGECQKNLFLLLSGSANVIRNSKTIATLNRGDFIAEISLLTQEPASADVHLDKNTKLIMWNQDQIRHFQSSNPTFWTKLHNILTKDLIEKVKS